MKKLKFTSKLPFALESKLVTKLGYAVEKRVPNESIHFIQRTILPKVIKNLVPTSSVNVHAVIGPSLSLSDIQQAELMRRCDNIVDFFPDPYNQGKAIRQRLHNMSQTLSVSERQFVLDYMDDNFPLKDYGN